MFRHKKFRTEKTAHYYTWGSLHADTKYAWIIFHGYGQPAPNLIGKWSDFDPSDHFVIAPEGLSRFYWSGVSGSVTSSWMTKRDRQDEIADYVGMLDNLYDRVGIKNRRDLKLILFGFSQGCATLWRWILNTHVDVDSIVFWAGNLPEDMLYHNHRAYLECMQLYYVIGDSDEYFSPEREQVLRNRFDSAGLKPTYYTFKGNHQVERSVLFDFFKTHLED
jgi:predicted esterase